MNKPLFKKLCITLGMTALGFLTPMLVVKAQNLEPRSGPMLIYPEIDSDLRAILARKDNILHTVNLPAKEERLEKIRELGRDWGLEIPVQSEQGQAEFLSLKNEAGQVEQFFLYEPGVEGSSLEDEIIVLRKSFRLEEAATQGLDNATLLEIANDLRANIAINTSAGDNVIATAPLGTRRGGEEDKEQLTLRQSQGFFRKLGNRQVINATLLVDVNPTSAEVEGLSLKNWWPLSGGYRGELKKAEDLKNEILGRFWENAGGETQVAIKSCRATFVQMSDVAVPTVTCKGRNLKDSLELATGSFDVTVSLLTHIPLNDNAKALATLKIMDLPVDDIVIDIDVDEDRNEDDTFSVFYTTDEERFFYGSGGFREYFGDEWTQVHHAYAYYNYFMDYDYSYPDAVDMVYVVGHGAVRGFSGQDSKIWVNSPSDPVTQLGDGDLEYFTHAGCHVGGAIYCEGMRATTRYTDSSSRDSIFNGLHILNANHGTGLSSNTIHWNKAKMYATYLKNGLSIIESWFEGEYDSNVWYEDSDNDCYVITDPDTDCSMDGTAFDCSRWSAYPSSFYVEEKFDESIDNRDSYKDDIASGDSGYDVDLIYSYQTEEIPISSDGYSLP